MQPHSKPFSQACEENQGPILEVLAQLLADARRLLEIGSGTGQHAVYFAARLRHLTWQTSDLAENLPGVRLWLAEAGLGNLPQPIELDVTRPWPPRMVDMQGTQEQSPAWPPRMVDMPTTLGMEELEPRLERRPRALVRNRSCIPDMSHIPVGQERSPAWPPRMVDMPATSGMEELEPRLERRPRALVRNRSCIPDMSHIPVGQERSPAWPTGDYDAAFSANTFHIMGDAEVAALFAKLPGVLTPGAPFALYGPFNYGGRYTSDSNARFDQWLKTRDPVSGIKDRDALAALAEAHGMTLDEDHPMPCNNRILVFRRLG